MDKIIIQRIVKPASKRREQSVIKIDREIYDKLSAISDDTGITLKRLASMLLDIAIDNTDIVDPQEETDNDN